jgi:hypothetical protein
VTEPPAPLAGTLTITGLGLVTALARDVISSCAAARAGMSRARLLKDFPLWNSTTCQPEPGTGHVVAELTHGFTGNGRLLRLGVAGLQDLNRSIDFRKAGKVALIVNLPSGYHFARAITGPLGGEEAPAVLAERIDVELRERRSKTLATFLPRLVAQAGIAVELELSRLHFGDEVGFVDALAEAARMLTEGVADACIVGGIDSQVDGETLQALHSLRILKSPDMPVGRIPGEAAAFIVIERAEGARQRDVQPLGLLDGYAGAREPSDRFDASRPTGEALARCLVEVVSSVAPQDGPRLLISDLNGEDYRAHDWALAMVRLRARIGFSCPAEWIPALSFGSLGAAAGPTAIAMACRGFARGYADDTGALAWLLADDGGRAALCVRAPANTT